MPNKKYIRIILFCILCANTHGIFAQDEGEEQEEIAIQPNWMIPRFYTDDDYVLRREWSLYLQGGISSLEYKTPFGTSSLINNVSNISVSVLGVGGGLSYTRFFTQRLGLVIGAEAASYKGYLQTDKLSETFAHNIKPVLFVNVNKGDEGIPAEARNTFSNYEETQSVWFLQVPLMLQFHRAPGGARLRFYGALGVKPALVITNSYDLRYSGNTSFFIPEYSQTLDNVGHGTGPFSQSVNGQMSLNFNLNASAELGIRWRLRSPEIALYTGLYADYGILNIMDASKKQDVVRPVETVANNLFATKYVDKVGTFAVGLKIRIAFGKMVMSADGEERTREMSKAYVRVLVRTTSNNAPLPTALRGAVDNKNRVKIDNLVYDVDDANYRIPLDRGSDYSAVFDVELPDYATPDVLQSAPAAAQEQEQEKDAKKDPNISDIKIMLVNKKTSQPLPAFVKIYNIDNQSIDSVNTATTNATFAMQTKPGSFHRVVFYVNVPLPPIPFKKVKVGAKLSLSDMFFETGKANLTQDMKDKLQDMVEFLQAYEDVRIEVSGHTDNSGNPKKNQQLSAKRAKAIVDYLIERGIPANRLKSIGYGDTRPIAPNKTKKGRAKNRRIEIKIIK